ncbi:hypothetical protein HNY73_006062 [Argiope bruennichi]|uniref:Uncharacterized protein n=1 Tax=Argiope bruennichi TaxID=94029 RepID=A0A8T0FKY6_ARGBR|nr:hypothetical protein HNY73_006062 [Argiope bruennichi]
MILKSNLIASVNTELYFKIKKEFETFVMISKVIVVNQLRVKVRREVQPRGNGRRYSGPLRVQQCHNGQLWSQQKCRSNALFCLLRE